MAMPIGSSGGNFTPASEGEHNAVLVDIVDLGIVKGFDERPTHKVRLVWEIEEKNDKGQQLVVSKTYSVSMHERATLRKDLKGWRGGKDFTAEELAAFDLESILGASCRVTIQHNERAGNVYANVTSVLKPKVKLTPSGGYKRRKDRDDWVYPGNSPWHPSTLAKKTREANGEPPLEEDEIPF
jgi:hypothetical protein